MESELVVVLPEFAGSRDVIQDLVAEFPADLTGTVVHVHALATRFVTVLTVDELIGQFITIRNADEIIFDRSDVGIPEKISESLRRRHIPGRARCLLPVA